MKPKPYDMEPIRFRPLKNWREFIHRYEEMEKALVYRKRKQSELWARLGRNEAILNKIVDALVVILVADDLDLPASDLEEAREKLFGGKNPDTDHELPTE